MSRRKPKVKKRPPKTSDSTFDAAEIADSNTLVISDQWFRHEGRSQQEIDEIKKDGLHILGDMHDVHKRLSIAEPVLRTVLLTFPPQQRPFLFEIFRDWLLHKLREAETTAIIDPKKIIH